MARKQTIFSGSSAIDVEADLSMYDWVKVMVGGLGAAETVAVNHYIGGTSAAAYSYDPAGATNNAIVFTGSGGTPANVNSMVLVGDVYRFTGNDPAGTVTIEFVPYNRVNT